MRNAAPFGADRTGLDDYDVNAERLRFHAQAIAETFQRELGRVIPAAERLAEFAADRRNVDDLAALLRAIIGSAS